MSAVLSGGRASTTLRAWRSPKVRYSCLLILVLLLLTLGAGWIAPSTYDEIDAAAAFSAPGGRFALGSDALGRDVLSRTLHGGRMSLVVGLLATLVAVLLGVPLGALAGYVGGKVDWLISRVVDLLLPFPVMINVSVIDIWPVVRSNSVPLVAGAKTI